MTATVRGRPPGSVRRTPHRPGWHGCEDKIAWLLRVNRLYGRHDRLASLTRFAAAFAGGCWPGPVSASQVSRWETAVTRASFNVLRRYEQLLGLAPRQLTAVADWAYRKASDAAGPPALCRGLDPASPQVHQRTEELLGQALSADMMTGADWDELTGNLSVMAAVFLHPRTAWADLSERLLAELLIADGPAWLSRIEALARLMALPRARAPIIAACAALAADPACQIVIEPLTILDLTGHADASRHVLDQLTQPASDRALRGALLAAIEKICRRHFQPSQLQTLADSAADLFTTADLHTEARHLAAALLRLAPAGQFGSVRDRLRRATDPITHAILTYGQTSSPATARHIITRIVATVTAQIPRHQPSSTDPMLARLIGDLLFSPNQNERLLAGLLIAATPYRDPVGTALATELTTPSAHHAVPLTTALLAAIPLVGHPTHRPAVERFITATGLAAPITEAAAWTIGHVPGHSTQQFWLSAINAHARAWEYARSPASMSALCGLTYALGITGNDHLLRTIRTDPHLPPPARTAASWWLGIPTTIHASAAH